MIEEIDATSSEFDSACLSQIQPDARMRDIVAGVVWL